MAFFFEPWEGSQDISLSGLFFVLACFVGIALVIAIVAATKRN